MWWLFVVVGIAGCASARVCPTESRFATEERPTGRVEWCAKATPGAAGMPAGRTFPAQLGMAHPAATSGLHGPFTHWYPSGGVESHGRYLEVGSASLPDGVWGFWYADGTRRSVGRYDRGQAVGCFAVWDEQGHQVTGIVDGNELRIEDCSPPSDAALTQIQKRSHPGSANSRWGDAAVSTSAQAGAFGARNPTQRDPDPSARVAVEATVRKHLGRFRVGPALGVRFSDSGDVRAYTAGAALAIAIPLRRRLVAEAEARLGLEYFAVTTSRMELPGTGSVSFWAPLGSARLRLAFALMPRLELVGGASLDGSPGRDADRSIPYCAPLCSPPVKETWELGGVAYGIDLGLRLLLR